MGLSWQPPHVQCGALISAPTLHCVSLHKYCTPPTAGHGVELPYVFHTAPLDGFHYTPDELVLSDTLINYWTNFARYGNPNGKGDHDARGIGKLHPQVGGELQCKCAWGKEHWQYDNSCWLEIENFASQGRQGADADCHTSYNISPQYRVFSTGISNYMA